MNQEYRQRDYTLDHALVLANASLNELNMEVTLKKVGNAGELCTYLCMLKNHNLQLSFRGAGSGSTKEAKVKAIYEAIEDSLMYQTMIHYDNVICMFSTLSSPSTGFLRESELLPDILRQEKYVSFRKACVTFNSANL